MCFSSYLCVRILSLTATMPVTPYCGAQLGIYGIYENKDLGAGYVFGTTNSMQEHMAEIWFTYISICKI